MPANKSTGAKSSKSTKKTITKTTINKKTTPTKKSTSKKIVKTEPIKSTRAKKVVEQKPVVIAKKTRTNIKTTTTKTPTKKIEKKPIVEKKTTVEKNETITKPKIESTIKPQESQIKKIKKSNAKKIARLKTNEMTATFKKLQRKVKIYGIQSVIPKHQIAVILCALVLAILLFTAVKNITFPKSSIDLDVVAQEIDQLKTVKFNFDEVESIVTNTKVYSSTIKKVYEYDYKDTFDVEKSWFISSSFYYNKTKKELFAVFKPKEEQRNNAIKSFDTFVKEKKLTNYETFEYDGYIFYIASPNNTQIISKIKQTQVRVFDILEEYNKSSVNDVYNVDATLYSDYMIKKAMLKTDTTEYVIFRPRNEIASKKIQELMSEYYEELEKKWSDANNETNLMLVKNRYFKIYDGYLVYIISRDNELVMHLIEK